MKNLVITFFVLFIVIIFILSFVCFQVREIESALVTRFGKPIRQITEPGLKFKLPMPIDRVYKFDSRLRTYEADIGETTTKGAVPIIVHTYVVWSIEDPLAFYNSVGTVKEAENKLRSQINDTQNKIIGKHYFSDFVNNDPEKIKFEQIQNEMLEDLRQSAAEGYGIKIATLGIKQLKISEEVSQDVFERMRAERNRKTEATIAQGKAEATRIRTEADSKKTELLAAAQARAKAIRGQGDAEAAQYYKLLEKDPALAMFLRDIEALKKMLEERTTIVLSADSAPLKLLRAIPELKN